LWWVFFLCCDAPIVAVGIVVQPAPPTGTDTWPKVAVPVAPSYVAVADAGQLGAITPVHVGRKLEPNETPPSGKPIVTVSLGVSANVTVHGPFVELVLTVSVPPKLSEQPLTVGFVIGTGPRPDAGVVKVNRTFEHETVAEKNSGSRFAAGNGSIDADAVKLAPGASEALTIAPAGVTCAIATGATAAPSARAAHTTDVNSANFRAAIVRTLL
jgi:hypothetical protein